MRAKPAQKPQTKSTARSARSFPWRGVVLAALRAAHATVKGLGTAAGQRVVAGREAGYRSWDPEVIGVDTATERAVIRVLERHGVAGTLLSEEAGERPLGKRSGVSEPVYVVMDPFDGSLLYRRGIRAHWFTALGIPVYQGYGLSETSPIIASNSNLPGNFKIGSSGRPFPWATVSIRDENDASLPRGETGEICVEGPCVMRGYWRNETATREAIVDGRLHTGDLGYLDSDGFLFVVGRIKSLLVGSNGEKYSPETLEQHLVDTVPLVAQVMLYNQQNPFTVALIVPDAGRLRDFLGAKKTAHATDAELDQVLEALRLDLMRYRKDPALTAVFVSAWTPKTFALLPEPFGEENGMMNASLKIVRRAIVARYKNRIARLYADEEDPLNAANRDVLRSLLERALP
jgi:acyl-CoA synthetase (AMP-forming)/AMP-acid ligase II